MTKLNSPHASQSGRRSPNDRNKRKRQLVLVGVLLFGLIIAIATQPVEDRRSSKQDETPRIQLAIKPVSRTLEQDDEEASIARFVSITALPSISPATWADVDLFEQPEPAKPVETDTARRPSVTRKKPVIQAVYGAFESNEGSALIDGKLIRQGENLDGGLRMLSVSEGGIYVTQ